MCHNNISASFHMCMGCFHTFSTHFHMSHVFQPLPTSRRGESRDRPGSVRGKNKQTKSAKDKKVRKE